MCLVAAAFTISATTIPCQLSKHSAIQPAVQTFIAACAKALKACPKGQSAIYAGGQALLQDDGSIVCLGKIAAATGATLICENAFPRIDRGAGLPHLQVIQTSLTLLKTCCQTFQLIHDFMYCISHNIALDMSFHAHKTVMVTGRSNVSGCHTAASCFCPPENTKLMQHYHV